MPSVVDRVARGVGWSVGSTAANRVITLMTTLILARLLTPRDFGLVALAVVALTLLNVLSDLGLTSVLVVTQDLDRRAQGTVLTLLVGAGTIATVALALAAPALADLFREPRLADVVRALAVLPLLSGFYWFYDTLLQREMQFGRRSVAETARNVGAAFVSIPLAAAGAGVWSLVGGQLIGALILTTTLPALAPYRVRPTFSRPVAGTTLRSGRAFLFQSAVGRVEDQLSAGVVGRALGADSVGLYAMARRLGELPHAGIAEPVARVAFSAFARLRYEGGGVASRYLRNLELVALVTLPLGVLLSATAHPFTHAVLGERWEGIIGPLHVFGIWAVVRAMETTSGWFLNAMGEAARSGWVATFLLVPLVPSLVAGAAFAGVMGVAWVAVGHLVATVVLQAAIADRRLGVPLTSQAKAILPLLLPAAACWAAARGTAEIAGDLAPALALVLSLAAGSLAYLALVRFTAPHILDRSARDVFRMLRQRRAEPRESTSRRPDRA